jgi:hypothetical protein
MKRVIFSMLVLLAALSSCSKDESTASSTETAISVKSLPVSVTTYVANNYPAETITSAVKVSNAAASYIVSLNTTEELAFDHNGSYLGDGAGYHADGDSIGGARHGKHNGDSLGGGHHGDSLGNGHHGGHGHGQHGGGIAIDSLPVAITEYIAVNYAGYTAEHAETDTLCQFGAVIEVMAKMEGSEPIKLFFDASGTFLMKGNRAEYSTAPQAVSDYITANYSTHTIRTRMEILTLADATVQYTVFMELSGVRKSVTVKSDGTFVCEK